MGWRQAFRRLPAGTRLERHLPPILSKTLFAMLRACLPPDSSQCKRSEDPLQLDSVLEASRVPNHQHAVGKSRVAMRSRAHVRHASCPIAPHGDCIADRPHASASRKLEAGFDRYRVSWTAEAILAADQVACRNSLIAHCEAQRNAAKLGDRVSHSAPQKV